MRISDLSGASGVTVATIKYYLRTGLLAPGEATAANQARYDESHLHRLRLVRALVEVAGLSLADVGAVVACLDEPATSWHEVLGSVHNALPPGPATAATPGAPSEAAALVRRLGWDVPDALPAVAQLDRALAAAAAAGLPASEGRLATYAAAARTVAESDVAEVPTTSPEEATRIVVIGTLVYEPVLLALRRMAQVDASARRFGTSTPA